MRPEKTNIVEGVANDSASEYNLDIEPLDSWASYILSRKEAYLIERRAIIGREYEVNRRMWDAIIDREWMVMEERLNGGVGVEQEILSQYELGFFKNTDQLLEEIVEMTSSLVSASVSVGSEIKQLTIYTFEDYLMLSNQGIFRDNLFILDPQSRWKRKIATVLEEYGYEQIDSLILEGGKFYVISKRR